jgi:hypothetical protein
MTKIGIIKSLDLLIIDEISMVRADLLDGVDSVLRRYRRSDRPFGGVQLLMIGDLFQLPPVVKDDDWRLLDPYYASPYFFSSNALGRTDMVTIAAAYLSPGGQPFHQTAQPCAQQPADRHRASGAQCTPHRWF